MSPYLRRSWCPFHEAEYPRFPYAGIPHPSPVSSLPICRPPPPRPASGLLPRPRGGRGQSWRYPGKAASGAYHQTLDRGRHRHGGRGQSWRYPGKIASGRANPRPAFSPGSPPYPGPWVISPRGWGRRGGGKKPPPLSLVAICRHLRDLASIWRPCPPVSGCNIPPPLPASGLLPRPLGGGGGSRGDT